MMMPFPDEEPRDEGPSRIPKTTSVDDRLARQVRDRLRADPDLARQHIRIDVQNGVALLSGTVDSPTAAESAAAVARATRGVRDICNALRQPEPGTGDPPGDGENPRRAGAGVVVDFETIAAELMAEHPSLRIRARPPRNRAARTALVAVTAIAWGLFCMLLVALMN